MQVKTHNELSPHTCLYGYSQQNKIARASKNAEKLELLCTAVESIKWCSHYGKQNEPSSKY